MHRVLLRRRVRLGRPHLLASKRQQAERARQGKNMRNKLLGLTVIAVLSLTACNSGGDPTNSGGDPTVKAAACARVATLASQIKDILAQERAVPIDANGPQTRQALARQWRTLHVERIAQNKVCVGAAVSSPLASSPAVTANPLEPVTVGCTVAAPTLSFRHKPLTVKAT